MKDLFLSEGEMKKKKTLAALRAEWELAVKALEEAKEWAEQCRRDVERHYRALMEAESGLVKRPDSESIV